MHHSPLFHQNFLQVKSEQMNKQKLECLMDHQCNSEMICYSNIVPFHLGYYKQHSAYCVWMHRQIDIQIHISLSGEWKSVYLFQGCESSMQSVKKYMNLLTKSQ